MNAEHFQLDYRPGNRWLRRKIDPARYRRLLKHCAAAVLVLLALVAAAWPRLEAVRLGYRVEELRHEKEELEKAVLRLRADLGAITEPETFQYIQNENKQWTASFWYSVKTKTTTFTFQCCKKFADFAMRGSFRVRTAIGRPCGLFHLCVRNNTKLSGYEAV